MSTIVRPIKRGDVQKFDDSYNKGFKNIRADEVDEEFDTLYDAWNFGIANVADGSITSDKLQDGAVTSSKLASNSVGTIHLIDGAVTRDKIADEAVTSSKIYPGSVGAAQLAGNSVSGANIIDGSVDMLELSTVVKSQLTPPWGGPDANKILAVNPGGSALIWATAPPSVPAGAATGDLGGNYPSPTVVKASAGFTVNSGSLVVSSSVAAAKNGNVIINSPVVTAKSRLLSHPTLASYAWTVNAYLDVNSNWTQDDPGRATWSILADASLADLFTINHAAPGMVSFPPLVTLNGLGSFYVRGGDEDAFKWGPGTRGHLMSNPLVPTVAFTANHYLASAPGTWGADDATKPSWQLQFALGSDNMQVLRAAANTPNVLSTLLSVTNAGNLTILGPTATKNTGTAWVNPSDPRLKRDMAAYTTGLEAIIQLQPVTFQWNGKGETVDDGKQVWGFDASEVQNVMPECVGTATVKLGKEDTVETEILTMDTSNILLALVNAVKELTARVVALESV